MSFNLPRRTIGRWKRNKVFQYLVLLFKFHRTQPWSRFVLSTTKELHLEIEKLQARIKELEVALAELQSHVSSKPHPLLAQYSKVKTERPGPDSAEDEDDLIDTFGSLTIDTNGETVWYGLYPATYRELLT
jgi:hypothetical protein